MPTSESSCRAVAKSACLAFIVASRIRRPVRNVGDAARQEADDSAWSQPCLRRPARAAPAAAELRGVFQRGAAWLPALLYGQG
jgi:hypothetical protein